MKISVIIPTYKPQTYIWQCLDSLTNQTLPSNDFEIIIVLNGCCEPWKNTISTYIESKMSGMNIQFVQVDLGGVSNARNIALDIAQGDYIAFIDDDDYVSNVYLQQLLQVAGVDTVALSNTVAFKDGCETLGIRYSIAEVFKQFNHNNHITISSKVRKYFSGPCMKLIPRNIIKERRFDIRFQNGEDSLFMFLISDKINKIRFAQSEAIYYRRIREGSAISNLKSKSMIINNRLFLIKEYLKIYLKNPIAYDFLFFITRILASIKDIVKNIV